MITLDQARKVKHGNYLNQEDVDFVNTFNDSDEKKLKYIECHAWQYYNDLMTEEKKARQFERNAY